MVIGTRRGQAVLLVLASVVLVGLLLEVAARAYSWHVGKGFWSRPHSFESAFFVTYDWPPPLIEAGHGTFRDGQRVAVVKAPDELRVVCLGGSTTVNGRSGGPTYSREVQRALEGRFGDHRVQILNAGADAFSTAHSLTNFSLRLLDFEPDVVTVLHNINDLTALDFGSDLQPDYSNKYLDDAFLGYDHRGGVGGAVFRFSRGAQMVKWRSAVLRRRFEKSSRGLRQADIDRGLAIFGRNLRSIIAVARSNGVRPVLMTQGHRDLEADAEAGAFRRYNDVTRQVGRQLDATVIDLAAEISGRRELFVDSVHLTSAGVLAVSALMAEPLAAELAVAAGFGLQPTPEPTVAPRLEPSTVPPSTEPPSTEPPSTESPSTESPGREPPSVPVAVSAQASLLRPPL